MLKQFFFIACGLQLVILSTQRLDSMTAKHTEDYPQATDSKGQMHLRNDEPVFLRIWSIFPLIMSCERNAFSKKASLFLLLSKKWTLSLQTNGKFLTHFFIFLGMKVLSVFKETSCWTLCPLRAFESNNQYCEGKRKLALIYF